MDCCPWGQMAVNINPSNIKARAVLLDQYKKSQLYDHNIVLAPLGTSRYDSESKQKRNLQTTKS